MADQWHGGVVESASEREPPSVGKWRPVAVPGRSEPFSHDETVAYRRSFPDPRRDPAERVVLELCGLAHRGRIWLNGQLVGEHDAYFVPARFELTLEEENDLVVECHPAEASTGPVDHTGDTRAPGIWWDATIHVLGPTVVGDLVARPRIDPDTGEGAIDVSLAVDAAEPIDDHVTFSLRPEGFRGGGAMERTRVEAEAGERVTVTKTLRVGEPARWWPRGYGPQHRYVVRAKLGELTREVTTGFSTVERDEDGVLVNGEPFRGRGVARLPGSDPEVDVQAAIEANANLLRAHAHVPPTAFHEACDEAGLLVWQDLPNAGPDLDVERGAEWARLLSRTRGHHPSIGLYGVHDDPRSPFESPLSNGPVARLRLRWRAWRTSYDRSAAETVADAFGDDRPVIAVSGPIGVDADASHLYPGWHYLDADSIEWLLDRYPGCGDVVGEFGAGSLVADVDPGTVIGLGANGASLDGVDGVDESQASQAATVRTVAERLRVHRSALLVAYALRDVDEAGGMGVLAADGTEKPAFEALTRSFEPVQAVLAGPARTGEVGLRVVNDRTEAIAATASWSAGEAKGSTSVSVDAHDVADAGTVEIPEEATEVRLALSLEDRTVRNHYSVE